MQTQLRSRAATYGATLVLALGAASGIGTTTAQAVESAHEAPAATDVLGCPSGDACFWTDSGWNGTMGHVSGNNPNFRDLHNSSGCFHFPGTWDDCVESNDNNGNSCTVYFWTGASYTGRFHSLAVGDAVDDFGLFYSDPTFNDSISSNHWCTSK